MKTPTVRFAVALVLVAVACLQLGAAGVDFRTMLQQLNKVMRKEVDKRAPTPEVELYPVPIGKPGQRLDLSIPGKDFANDAMVYFADPFVDHIAQKVVSGTRISATIALGADAWPGLITGVVVNPSSRRRMAFDAVRVPGRLELDLKAENGLRIRFTEAPPTPDGMDGVFVAEFFKPGSSTPFVKGVGSLNRIFDSEGGVSGAINSDSEEIPPCGGFDLDIASIGPGKATFTGRVQCDDQVELKITGAARRLQ
jgi:hypothetical protein